MDLLAFSKDKDIIVFIYNNWCSLDGQDQGHLGSTPKSYYLN